MVGHVPCKWLLGSLLIVMIEEGPFVKAKAVSIILEVVVGLTYIITMEQTLVQGREGEKTKSSQPYLAWTQAMTIEELR